MEQGAAFAQAILVLAVIGDAATPAAQSGQGRSFAARACGAWSEPTTSTIPSRTAALAACICRASRMGGFMTA